ncbi:MAG: MarR family transcriptional regulator [Vicinamibacterales bacterium]
MPSKLQEELKQAIPIKRIEEEAYLSIVRTAAVLEHSLAQALKPYDITPTQYNVLRILRGSGETGLCRNEVGCRLVRAVPDVTRLLDRMEEMGMIVRERGTEDRRLVSTRITKKGSDLLARLDDRIDEIHAEQLGHISKRDLKTLVALLGDIRDR